MSRDHFYFSRNDRIVALILLGIITIIAAVRYPWSRKESRELLADTDTILYLPDTVRRRVYIRDTIRIKWYVRDTVLQRLPARKDSVSIRRITKTVAPLSPLDLNTSDSAGLVSVPGIGPVFASRIIRYREQLGGFLTVTQLSEINGIPDSLMKWFIVTDTFPLRMIRVNSVSVSELRRHPYVNFYQARAIVEYRKERGVIKGPEQLSFMEEFTAQDLDRLLPYLDFR